ncbi:3-hydroxybutyryl-CoA dehydrogenase [Bacillus sp. UMB0899]|nr:3-hydroxybutyryl-CoA dehydrogenase [Bacillus sp. UMB0899]
MMNKTIAVIGENLLAKRVVGALEKKVKGIILFNEFSLLEQADLVIETTNLHIEEKKRNLQQIESIVSPDTCILSSILHVSATEAASWLQQPDRLVGFAAFADFYEHDLVEVALPLQADLRCLQYVQSMFQLLGIETEVVEDEVGLVFPRILSLIINEAAFALTEGTASAYDIDQAMKKGTNYPLGPFEWCEKIGLDDVYAVLAGLYKQYGEERYRPAPLMKKLVYAGWIGGEKDKCFYHYQNRNIKEFSL